MAQLLNLKFFLYLYCLGVDGSPLKASRRNVVRHFGGTKTKLKINTNSNEQTKISIPVINCKCNSIDNKYL